MNRRELIKAILPVAAIPLTIKNEVIGQATKIEPSARYVVFVNGHLVDPVDFCENERSLPGGTVIHTVYPSSHQSMDDAIRIYKVE